MNRILIIVRALSLGLVIDLVATFVFVLLLQMMLSGILVAQGVAGEQMTETMMRDIMRFPWFHLAMLGGTIISIATGFIVAENIGHNPYPWLGLFGTLLLLASNAMSGGVHESFAHTLFYTSVTIGSVMAGGWLQQWARSDETPPKSR